MPYADADFFFALIKNNDRLNKSAKEIYQRYKGSISTSLAVVLELLLISRRHNIPARPLVGYVLDIAKIEQVDPAAILLAAVYMDEQKLGIFDAFHAALCKNEIISSDHIYDKLGIKRTQLNSQTEA